MAHENHCAIRGMIFLTSLKLGEAIWTGWGYGTHKTFLLGFRYIEQTKENWISLENQLDNSNSIALFPNRNNFPVKYLVMQPSLSLQNISIVPIDHTVLFFF